MKDFPLKIFAGREALAHIRKNGLRPDDISMILAASGGPKWLALASMDAFLLSEWFSKRLKPLHLLGTSAGAWRMACYAQKDPLSALGRFKDAYLSQTYSPKPTPGEVSRECRRILGILLGENGAKAIVNHSFMRYHTIAARCRGLISLDSRAFQTLGLVAAMLLNAISPNAIRPFFERFLFYHPKKKPPIDHFPHVPVRRIALSVDNIRKALLATGAVPTVISGVKDIQGAPAGTYRDGALTDYQFDLPALPDDGFVLYPHFSARPPIPGWFDKKLRWRKPSLDNYRRAVILAPSEAFVATLPGGRIPDRHDFYAYSYPERRARWEKALSTCEKLGEAMSDIHSRRLWASLAEPLPWS
ncbi:conserved hypothetical protein [Candidatus Desulfarcum epimagneticum]|uniref:Uncharacterized protein n=1 Tax=uncultured Desulfobacteraceae bacterium TaxID=218296 RepID=A0A484HNJ7_9BACT|nr:conserved hypothetical protein [uncultured Desulfobacteraceae bacterium]